MNKSKSVKWKTFNIDESDYENDDYPYEVLARQMTKLKAKNFIITYSRNIDCSEGENFYIEGVYCK